MMKDYFQPTFYRFNEDSLQLISYVVNKFNHSHQQAKHLLDLGAGCGILGIEIAQKLKTKSLTLVEVQAEYSVYIENNINQFLGKEIVFQIIISSFAQWRPEIQYDLIVCNPPYFLPGHGRLGPNHQRNTARTFLIDDWQILLKKVEEALAPQGSAFFVFRNDVLIKQIIEKNLTHNLSFHFHHHENKNLILMGLTCLNKKRGES